MRYGIYLPNYGPYGDAKVLAALAHEAEQAGWDGFFLWDHIAPEGPVNVVDPWVALTAVALNTERIRIGTTVTPVPRRRPWKLARETVSLDRLSGGRLILGVGIGLGEGEWDDLGEEPDQAKRAEMLDEGLDILTGLWRAEPFSYEGKYYHIKQAHFLPGPLQQPRIPIWVGGFWPNKRPMRRAARWDGAFPLMPWTDESTPENMMLQFKDAVAYIQDQRAAQGIEGPIDIVHIGGTPPHIPGLAALDANDHAEAGATWWLEMLYPYRWGWTGDGPWPVEAMREGVLQGPPK